MNRPQWFDDLTGGLSKDEVLALSPGERARRDTVIAQVKAITVLAKADALRCPPVTPCLDRWRRHQDDRGPLWQAACWEQAAVTHTDPDRRVRGFQFSRAIIAVARGELVPFRPDAARKAA